MCTVYTVIAPGASVTDSQVDDVLFWRFWSWQARQDLDLYNPRLSLYLEMLASWRAAISFFLL